MSRRMDDETLTLRFHDQITREEWVELADWLVSLTTLGVVYVLARHGHQFLVTLAGPSWLIGIITAGTKGMDTIGNMPISSETGEA